ncbi:hypothetical protein [Rosettibacter firmus]|uniref:hypothetical protein n=1 Tax=Rosettibacter firmus TaxID=3111522 RepID=UPI00336BF307
MEKLTNISKTILFITLLFLIFWLGGYVARHLVIYQFFEPENLELKPLFQNNSLNVNLYLILPLFVFNIISYIIFLITFILFLFISKINLKNEGWLLITTLIIIITAPFEIYLLVKDYQISKSIYYNLTDAVTIINFIRERITSLNGFSLIEIFSYCAIIFLLVFKPLRKVK